MASYLSFLNPVPRFPDYTGAHRVGTVDIEIPAAELHSPSACPAGATPITTVQYRIFYPCAAQADDGRQAPITWLPAPQQASLSAYIRFGGAGSRLAEFVSYFPRILHYIKIPALKDATLLSPGTGNGRWPVIIFSHGLGGSRNAYSHLVGSLASHGVVLIVPEHRDGSCPASFVRTEACSDADLGKKSRIVNYKKIAHDPTPEIRTERNDQLKIRLWELGLIFDSILKLDEGCDFTNLNTDSAPLSQFQGLLDVHDPGKITFAGHSFGAATMTQLVKSTFYAAEAPVDEEGYDPIFSPEPESAISKQITPHTPVVLLDVWCLPFRAPSTLWLWSKPMPCYAPSGPGGSSLLAVESQAFVKWRMHFKATKRLLSPEPLADSYNYADNKIEPPHFYYPVSSAHLSQSDFGILFSWIVRKALATEEPERLLRLNVRAILQVLRTSGCEVSATSRADMELSEGAAEGDVDEKEKTPAVKNDTAILSREEGAVAGWTFLTTDLSDLVDVDDDTDKALKGIEADQEGNADPAAAVLKNEVLDGSTGVSGGTETQSESEPEKL